LSQQPSNHYKKIQRSIEELENLHHQSNYLFLPGPISYSYIKIGGPPWQRVLFPSLSATQGTDHPVTQCTFS